MTQNTQFAYQTSLQAEQELALRLNDPGNVRWLKTELNLYIAEALRLWNCLTQTWIQNWTATYTSASKTWQSTGNGNNPLVGSNPTSPRYQTLTDSDVYAIAQYHLLEPPTGNGTWTGTNQFSLMDFVNAFQGRRDTILQAAACYMGPLSISMTPGTNSVQLPDSTSQSVLDVRRVRFVPAASQGVASTLYRDDGMAFEYFNNGGLQAGGPPLSWDVLAGPPLYLTFDEPSNVPNTLDILAMFSGGTVTPPTSSPLLIPDDWSWVLKFGMMADLLREEGESQDLLRAQYCEKRFEEGLKLMVSMPWLTQARIDNVPCDTPSVIEADEMDYEWQTNSAAQPGIIRGGIDLFAVSPPIPAATNVAVTLSLVGNAPIPTSDGAFVQVGRDVMDSILDEAQHLAMFKEGGAEFKSSMSLHEGFIAEAMNTNRRLRESGIFPTDIRPPVSRQDEDQPRFAEEKR